MKAYYFVLTDFFDDYGSELFRSVLYPTYDDCLRSAYLKRDDMGFFCEIDVRDLPCADLL